MITSLHHYFKIENINLFGISSLISWANTFKIQEFRPKIENFHHHSNFFMKFIRRRKYLLPLFIITLKSKISFFFWISSLISWVNTFKNREFRPKIENFHHHSKKFHDVSTEKKQ